MPNPTTPEHSLVFVASIRWSIESAVADRAKKTCKNDAFYVVNLSYLAEVIQKSGKLRYVYLNQDALDDLMDRFLMGTGGIVATSSATHQRCDNMVGARGFEPPTPCTQNRCATRLRHAPTVAPS